MDQVRCEAFRNSNRYRFAIAFYFKCFGTIQDHTKGNLVEPINVLSIYRYNFIAIAQANTLC